HFVPGTLVVFTPKAEVVLTTDVATHFILIGGPKLDGSRIVWWNFVSSSQERIEAAKADWRSGRLAPVPGDDEFIPLPELMKTPQYVLVFGLREIPGRSNRNMRKK